MKKRVKEIKRGKGTSEGKRKTKRIGKTCERKRNSEKGEPENKQKQNLEMNSLEMK